MIRLTKDGIVNRARVTQEIDRLVRLADDLREIRDGVGPAEVDLNEAPILDHWARQLRPVPCLAGEVSDHPLLPGQGRPIVTSDVWVLAEHQGWARTLSRWYRLGRPHRSVGASF